MGPPPVPAPELVPAPAPNAQAIGRGVLALALIVLGVWTVQDFLPALVWAAIFAIATWPLYRRLAARLPGLAPILLTLVIALVFAIPLVLLAFGLAHEARDIVQFVVMARHEGVPVPDWVRQLPLVGGQAADWWAANLADPASAEQLFGHINTRELAQPARQYGGEVVHGLTTFVFTLLIVFFLYRDGDGLTRQMLRLSDRLIGERGEAVALQMIAAVHGTVTGLVLVGLAEGALLGVAYAIAGLPHAVSFGALTGVLAVIPFGAPVVFGGAALFLVAQGSTLAAAGVVGFGFLVTFVADHFVRPVLIGGAARLPFLWVLLGILGGLHAFGLLGLFVGPAVLAALISLWRDWTQPAIDARGLILEPGPALEERRTGRLVS